MKVTLLTLHIIAAGGWIGGNMVQAFAANGFKTRSTDARIAWAETSLAMARVYYSIIGAVLLVTGIMLLTVVQDSPYSFSDPFVSIGFLAVLLGIGLGVGVFAPTARRWATALNGNDVAGATAAENRITVFGVVDSVVVVLTIAAMVAKFGV